MQVLAEFYMDVEFLWVFARIFELFLGSIKIYVYT